MKSRIVPVIITAALTSLVTFFVVAKFSGDNGITKTESYTARPPVNYVNYSGDKIASSNPVDFQPAAEASVPAVVHIKTKINGRQVLVRNPFPFWGDAYDQMMLPPQLGAGSGVVISPEGYIVTNNHVVANADVVTVTFNDRYTAEAKIVATDPSTDIAVIKVEEKNLPYMEFGNSDDVRLGQWVLAVGYPLTLDATVTAGIVSAKGRSLGINRTQSQSAIESFIQTDAAVNPGNSGGALVNTAGQLIGINSAIASPTGSYAGYSYAIPANIVKKVVNDLIDYGSVQRAYLGIRYLDRKMIADDKISEFGLDKNDGVYIYEVIEGGGADEAGLKKGDFITRINGIAVHSSPELLEQIARFKPGDNISITYARSGSEKQTTVLLKNIEGNTGLIKNVASAKILGAKLNTVSTEEKKKYGIPGGIKVADIEKGIISEQTAMQKNFIITQVNDQVVNTVEELQNALASNGDRVRLAGFYPGKNGMYYYGLKLSGEVRPDER